jgi:uncharacterized protein YggE
MRIIKVTGRGKATAEPDIVILSLRIETKAKEYAACLSELNHRTDDLRASITASGIERTELKTENFNVFYDAQFKDGKQKFIGYRASHNLSIEIPLDKDLLNQILGLIAEGHSEAQVNLSFSVKDKDGLHKRTLTDAVQTAKANAETLAIAAGETLGKLQEIDYGGIEINFFNRAADVVCNEEIFSMKLNADIDPKDIIAESNVTLVYELNE